MIKFNGYNITFSNGKVTVKVYPNEDGIFEIPLKALDLTDANELLAFEAFANSEQIPINYI